MMISKLRLFPFFVIVVGIYTTLSAIIFNLLPLRVTKDGQLYKSIAEQSLLSDDFWLAWRPFTAPLFYKIASVDDVRITVLQGILAWAAWMFLAITVVYLLENWWAKRLAFMAVLGMSLNIDFFMWHRIVNSESIANSLAVIVIAISLLMHRALRKHPDSLPYGNLLAYRQQILWGGGLAIGFVLWGFTLPTNYFVALSLAGTLSSIFIILTWRFPPLRQMWIFGSLIILSLVTVFVGRNLIIDAEDAWQDPFMNSLAGNILPYPDRTAFFAERGMPHDEAALYFAGWRPVRYAGDWQAIFGDWIEAHGRRTYLEYMLSDPVARISEPAENWDRILNPHVLFDMFGHEESRFFSDWQQRERLFTL